MTDVDFLLLLLDLEDVSELLHLVLVLDHLLSEIILEQLVQGLGLLELSLHQLVVLRL